MTDDPGSWKRFANFRPPLVPPAPTPEDGRLIDIENELRAGNVERGSMVWLINRVKALTDELDERSL